MMSEQNVVTDLFASWLWMFAQRKKQRFKWTLTFERGFEFSNCLFMSRPVFVLHHQTMLLFKNSIQKHFYR